MIPLWDEDNRSLISMAVEVKPGMAVLLFATGLEHYKVRQDSKTAKTTQRICVSRLLPEYHPVEAVTVKAPAMSMCDCGFVFRCDATMEIIGVAEEFIASNGCVWQLTALNNFRILAIPGLYRLHLNDETAIGKAQVYAEQYNLQDLPQQVPALFFS